MADLNWDDTDAVLANVPHTERARVLVDRYSEVQDAFLAEFVAADSRVSIGESE
ncbi:hypothetical protein P3H15_27465 [Rhodococcus sp. T2V]|uniref:hypothetical protein n=1 Tax=Rhodococcus sp. T2V TaxID=3034164 RepID=UPI0023E0A26F|nr:hypothetical protein [Rhodococcus sp. T2V]MDF3308762.1 hypothetical protein [Rhodococcus sp. T2V]